MHCDSSYALLFAGMSGSRLKITEGEGCIGAGELSPFESSSSSRKSAPNLSGFQHPRLEVVGLTQIPLSAASSLPATRYSRQFLGSAKYRIASCSVFGSAAMIDSRPVTILSGVLLPSKIELTIGLAGKPSLLSRIVGYGSPVVVQNSKSLRVSLPI